MSNKEIRTIVPISLDDFWVDDIDKKAEQIIALHKEYGFKEFLLAVPSHVGSNYEYPPKSFWTEKAKLFAEIKNKVSGFGIKCGWWIGETVTGGFSDEMGSMIRSDGTPISNKQCVLDPVFVKRFSEDAAEFAKIAKPEFIFLEDDFFIGEGCFCERHLNAFAERMGRYYSREELKRLGEGTEDIEALRKWREFSNDTLISLAKALREAIDKASPEIPIGAMQSGWCDFSGDITERLGKTLAGERHTPFSRFEGSFYCGVNEGDIPYGMYGTLARKQHIKCEFETIYEADFYPHTRFFHTASEMRTLLALVFSYGYDGALFFAVPYVSTDKPIEEPGYAGMYKEEYKRFNEVSRLAKKCKIKGAELPYMPFYQHLSGSSGRSEWIKVLGKFAIPYTSEKSEVAFWDETTAKYSDDETVREYLAKGLFLDADAARVLCERGYGKHIGVDAGDIVRFEQTEFNQGAQEVVCEGFAGDGRSMTSAYHWCPHGNGVNRYLTPNNPNCELVTELYSARREFISAAMTFFENDLGGRIVAMGTTLKGNSSQNLFNYPRQRLLQDLITRCGGEYVFARHAPRVHCTMNEFSDDTEEMIGMITLISYCPDDMSRFELYLPEKWRKASEFLTIGQNGQYEKLSFTATEDGISVGERLRHNRPLYIIAKK